MLRTLTGWIRLAIVLSIIWLVGIGLYAGYAWSNRWTVDSPFVYYVALDQNGEVVALAGRVFDASFVYGGGRAARFNWLWFVEITGGTLAGIWALGLGTPWIVEGFRRKAEPTFSS